MLALITATRNSIETLPDTLTSIVDIRHRVKSFFVDGGSTDGTVECLQSYIEATTGAVLFSQDGLGLYQALNQGIQEALNDPDVTHIGMLHSDDQLIPASFDKYLTVIENEPAAVFYSGIEFRDHSGAVVRVWRSSEFSRFKLNTGWMPPHTSIVVAKDVYRDLGLYDPNFGTAADYEWVVRVFSERGNKVRFFPELTVSMLVGGASSASMRSRLRANSMDGKVWAGRSWLRSMMVRICKPMRKLGQFIFVR